MPRCGALSLLQKTRTTGPQLSLRFDSRATHAHTLLPAALASVSFGFVLARVRVRVPTHKRTEGRAPVWGSEFTTKDAHYRGVQKRSLLG